MNKFSRFWKVVFLGIFLSASQFAQSALHTQAFSAVPMKTNTVVWEIPYLAIVDTSETSRRWLTIYQDEFVKRHIPIVVLSNAQDLVQLKSDLPILSGQMGLVPDPMEYMDSMLNSLGVPALPAMIDTNALLIWQTAPKEWLSQ